ncbi:resistin isoform X1 [Candoia aspera]|uniref:resistin isoform X1 n=1 Tax=Candoia aspera TaxID=51853 RepID=UPI002FD8587A
MKTLTRFLLLAVLLSAKYASAQKSLVDLKIQESVAVKVSSLLMTAQLVCQDVFARGAEAACPSGFIPTGCGCGMGCGSWDIRGNSVCHCQCARIDWTSSRCCKVAVAG